MPPSRKRPHPTSATPFVYIGAGDYGQHIVDDAPGYKKGAKTKLRRGIVIMRAATDGGPLAEIGFYSGPEFGWLAFNGFTCARLFNLPVCHV